LIRFEVKSQNTRSSLTFDRNQMRKWEFRIHPEHHLSRNFQVKEVFASVTADKRGIINIPNDRREMALVLRNARALARNVLQPIRDEFGVMKITSWFRCPILNKAIGGTDKSQHLLGEAADFVTPDAYIADVFFWLANIDKLAELKIDQVISESRKGGTLIHASHKRKGLNRRCALISPMRGNYTYYS